MSEKKTGVESLIVWQASIDLAVKVCQEILNLLPSNEKFALAPQLQRPLQSIPANITEGYGCYYYQDNVRFGYIARGSLEETISHLTLACKLGCFSKVVLHSFMQLTNELRRMLNGYIAFLNRSKRGENEPGAEHQEDPNKDTTNDLLLEPLALSADSP